MKKPKAKQQRSSKARLKQNPPIKVKKQSGEKKFKIPTMKSLKESLSKEAVTGKKEMVLNTVIHILLLLLNPLLIYYFVEAIYWQSFSRALGFLVLESAPAIHMLNVGVILILELLLWFLTNRVGLSFGITAFISCGLAIVNELKMEARGEAFTLGIFLWRRKRCWLREIMTCRLARLTGRLSGIVLQWWWCCLYVCHLCLISSLSVIW